MFEEEAKSSNQNIDLMDFISKSDFSTVNGGRAQTEVKPPKNKNLNSEIVTVEYLQMTSSSSHKISRGRL